MRVENSDMSKRAEESTLGVEWKDRRRDCLGRDENEEDRRKQEWMMDARMKKRKK